MAKALVNKLEIKIYDEKVERTLKTILKSPQFKDTEIIWNK